jgi:hypothetical protein
MRTIIIIALFISFSVSLFPQGKWRMIDKLHYGSLKYRSIDCYDSLNCVAVGNENWTFPLVRLTSDGGKTWHTVLHDTIRRDENGKIIWWPKQALDIAYPDSNLIFVLCDFGIYWYSTTKGKSWVGPVNTKKRQMYENWCSFYSAKIGGYLSDNKAWITYDTCKSFENLEPDSTLGPDDLSIPDSNTIFLLCYIKGWDRLYRSLDKGKTWEKMNDPPLRIRRIFFFDSLEGYGYGGYRVDTQKDKDVILHTTDGGRTWEIQLDTLIGLKNKGLIQMSFYKDRNNGVTIGYKGKLFFTKNGGKTWIYNNTYSMYVSGWPADAHQVSPHRYFVLTQDHQEIWENNIYSYVSVDEKNITGNIILSPNPATDYIDVILSEAKHPFLSVKVYDVLGVCVLTHPPAISREGESVRIDVSDLAAGVYFVRFGGKMYKFVKM